MFASLLGVGEDESFDFAAADEAVVPAEVVVQEEVEFFGLAFAESLDGALLDFGFEAAAAKGAFDAAIEVEEGFGSEFLGAGPFGAGDEAEGDGFAGAGGFGEGLENRVLHGRGEDS